MRFIETELYFKIMRTSKVGEDTENDLFLLFLSRPASRSKFFDKCVIKITNLQQIFEPLDYLFA